MAVLISKLSAVCNGSGRPGRKGSDKSTADPRRQQHCDRGFDRVLVECGKVGDSSSGTAMRFARKQRAKGEKNVDGGDGEQELVPWGIKVG